MPCDVAVLGDAIRAVKVVKKIGMKCIGTSGRTRGSELPNAGADLVFPDFTELKLSDLFAVFQPPIVVELKAASLLS
jgi:phosphoglycolate phosphatase-like HAD superfamily hydrolase